MVEGHRGPSQGNPSSRSPLRTPSLLLQWSQIHLIIRVIMELTHTQHVTHGVVKFRPVYLAEGYLRAGKSIQSSILNVLKTNRRQETQL